MNKKLLSVFGLAMINVIAIDSLRNLPSNAATGFTLVFYYLIASVFFLIPYILITAELATHHPKTGGAYVWVREAFGRKWGFVNIWLQWIYNVVWYPTILSFIAVNAAYLINPSLAHNTSFILICAIAMFTLSTIANSFGIRLSSIVSSISAIVGTLIPMLFIIILGIIWYFKGNTPAFAPQTLHLTSIFNGDNAGFMVVVLFSLIGFEMSATHAGDVKNPQRDYPKALTYSALIIVTTAILASLSIAIVVPAKDLSIIGGLDQAYALFLSAFHMQWLMPIVISLIILGAFGGISAWVIGPTKSLMVAGDDGCMPASLAYRNKHGVPIVILSIQLLIVIVLCGLYTCFDEISTWYWILSDLTAQVALLFYIVMFLAALRLRYINPERKPGCFQIPGGKFGIWVTVIVGVASCLGGIVIGFIPPNSANIKSVVTYESILITGILIMAILPLLIYRSNQID